MATATRRLNTRQIEDSLGRLRDVHAARVSLSAGGDAVEEIHVLASPSRKPKQIVRDIESLLLVNFRTRIDYRRVSLVQASSNALASYFRRPKLVSVKQNTDDGLRVEVRLAYADGLTAVGSAQAEADALDECRVAALATIRALSTVVNDVNGLGLVHAEAINFHDRTVALVHLLLHTDQREEQLLGVSFAVPDVAHGAARATLAAVNRRFF